MSKYDKSFTDDYSGNVNKLQVLIKELKEYQKEQAEKKERAKQVRNQATVGYLKLRGDRRATELDRLYKERSPDGLISKYESALEKPKFDPKDPFGSIKERWEYEKDMFTKDPSELVKERPEYKEHMHEYITEKRIAKQKKRFNQNIEDGYGVAEDSQGNIPSDSFVEKGGESYMEVKDVEPLTTVNNRPPVDATSNILDTGESAGFLDMGEATNYSGGPDFGNVSGPSHVTSVKAKQLTDAYQASPELAGAYGEGGQFIGDASDNINFSLPNPKQGVASSLTRGTTPAFDQTYFDSVMDVYESAGNLKHVASSSAQDGGKLMSASTSDAGSMVSQYPVVRDNKIVPKLLEESSSSFVTPRAIRGGPGQMVQPTKIASAGTDIGSASVPGAGVASEVGKTGLAKGLDAAGKVVGPSLALYNAYNLSENWHDMSPVDRTLGTISTTAGMASAIPGPHTPFTTGIAIGASLLDMIWD